MGEFPHFPMEMGEFPISRLLPFSSPVTRRAVQACDRPRTRATLSA